jgi:hypothetical protein
VKEGIQKEVEWTSWNFPWNRGVYLKSLLISDSACALLTNNTGSMLHRLPKRRQIMPSKSLKDKQLEGHPENAGIQKQGRTIPATAVNFEALEECQDTKGTPSKPSPK